MNAIYSSEGQVTDQFRPDCTNLFVGDFESDERPMLSTPVEFENDFELEFARTLDENGIAWHYKPRTFAVEWDEDGNFIDSLTPSFFLPARDMYVELIAADCSLSIEKARKARMLLHEYPAIRIEVLPVSRWHQLVERLW
jgi:hypothetical protein